MLRHYSVTTQNSNCVKANLHIVNRFVAEILKKRENFKVMNEENEL